MSGATIPGVRRTITRCYHRRDLAALPVTADSVPSRKWLPAPAIPYFVIGSTAAAVLSGSDRALSPVQARTDDRHLIKLFRPAVRFSLAPPPKFI